MAARNLIGYLGCPVCFCHDTIRYRTYPNSSQHNLAHFNPEKLWRTQT